MTKIKICGLRRCEDIEIVNKYKPDYIGFVFAKGKVRTIDKNMALSLKKILSSDIIAVGVFRNNPLDEVIDISKSGAIDVIQLHGDEDKTFINELKKEISLPIIKAYKDYEECDFALFDNPDPGKGMMFDWSKIDHSKKFFLAGGLSCENVLEALKLNPYAVDVSSGVETNGFKDSDKVNEFIRLVREYEG